MTKSTITRERLEKIKSWRETYGAGSNVMLPAEEAEELARIALAAMDSEPVGYFGRFDPDDEDLIDQCSKNVKGAFPLYRHAQPAPVVPEEWTIADAVKFCKETGRQDAGAAMDAWNACRSAMLQAEPVTTANKLGNSPVIPDGYVMVPKVLTEEMIAAAMNCEDVIFNSDDSFCVQFGNIYDAMLAAAPQEVKP
ncbi:hypothetical protein WI942_002500 [Klebsiella aerogenes]